MCAFIFYTLKEYLIQGQRNCFLLFDQNDANIRFSFGRCRPTGILLLSRMNFYFRSHKRPLPLPRKEKKQAMSDLEDKMSLAKQKLYLYPMQCRFWHFRSSERWTAAKNPFEMLVLPSHLKCKIKNRDSVRAACGIFVFHLFN